MRIVLSKMRAHMERETASPALRLLDDCLQLLSGAALSESAEGRMREAVEALEAAFDEALGGGGNAADAWAAAAGGMYGLPRAGDASGLGVARASTGVDIATDKREPVRQVRAGDSGVLRRHSPWWAG